MGQIFQSFISGVDAGQQQSEQRQRRDALEEAGRLYASGNAQGAENTLVGAGLVNEAGAYSALAEARRGRRTREAVSGAMTSVDPNASPTDRLAAGANAALGAGDTDQWFALTQAASQMTEQERAQAGQRAQWIGSAAASLLDVPVEERVSRAQALLAASPYAGDQHIAQMIDEAGELSDEALNAAAHNSMSAADILAGRERQERYAVQDRQADREYGLQAAQFNLQRESADRQAALQEQMFGSEAVEYAARQYRQTGRMPALGMGANAAAMRQQILSRAAQMARSEGSTAEADVITQRALQANSQALGRITTQRAQIHNFEQTALRNLELAVAASERVPRLGSPIVNDIVLEARRRGGGDPDVQQLVIAIETFAEEYAKVMSGATGGAAATDSAREQAHRMINASMTVPQIRAVAEQMRAEMANRMHSLDAEQQSLTDAMRTPFGESISEPATPAAPDAAPTAAPAARPRGSWNALSAQQRQTALERVRQNPALAAEFQQTFGMSVEEAARRGNVNPQSTGIVGH